MASQDPIDGHWKVFVNVKNTKPGYSNHNTVEELIDFKYDRDGAIQYAKTLRQRAQTNAADT